MNILLKEAIQAQKLVEITCNGSTYLAEPYCYGKVWTGQEALRAYIVNAPSGSHTPSGWHLFLLGDIQNFRVLPSTFEEIRTDFDAYDLAMFFIYCRVEKRQTASAPKPSFIGDKGHSVAQAYI
jgi:hypothetical protein